MQELFASFVELYSQAHHDILPSTFHRRNQLAKLQKKLPALTKSEWLVMARLWEKSPLTAAELVEMKLDGKTLPNATVRTLLRHLVAKKVVNFTVDEHNANLYHYFPLIAERDYIRKENKNFLEMYYHNDRSKFFAAFIDDVGLSDDDIDLLRKMLNEKKES
jgi:BlaI family penicillinase repressor